MTQGGRSDFAAGLRETDKFIMDARSTGAQKICPVEFQKVTAMRSQALRVYYSCNPGKGETLINAAFVKAKGLCPTSSKFLDFDGDGIHDDLDNCPGSPEDMDGFRDKDGCPDNDNDFDGIADSNDNCPFKPEDKDGFQDLDGCPEVGGGQGLLTKNMKSLTKLPQPFDDTDQGVSDNREWASAKDMKDLTDSPGKPHDPAPWESPDKALSQATPGQGILKKNMKVLSNLPSPSRDFDHGVPGKVPSHSAPDSREETFAKNMKNLTDIAMSAHD